MNIAEINTVNYGSTGKIMLGIQQIAREEGHSVYSYYAIGKEKQSNPFSKQVGRSFYNKLSSKLAHVTGMMGCFSLCSTIKLIHELKRKKIELIHLHNIHISFLNYPLLFRYIKRNDIKVVWTLHDCWSFTGHCAHFTYPSCEKWVYGCSECSRYKEYPISTFDNSKFMYRLKKKVFIGVPNMTLVTPSFWLKGLVEKSFLKKYPVEVINNGIDLSQFYPIESSVRDSYGVDAKFLILGVSFDWNNKKGLDVFLELSRRLEEDRFQIVLVGTDDKVDKLLPPNIISIHKTNNSKELAELYTAADLFVNPTREEVLGLVNIEANACGTPVLMFRTGGSPECINTETGLVVEVDDVNSMEKHIRSLAESNYFHAEQCVQQAKKFDMNDKYREYVSLYRKMIKENREY